MLPKETHPPNSQGNAPKCNSTAYEVVVESSSNASNPLHSVMNEKLLGAQVTAKFLLLTIVNSKQKLMQITQPNRSLMYSQPSNLISMKAAFDDKFPSA